MFRNYITSSHILQHYPILKDYRIDRGSDNEHDFTDEIQNAFEEVSSDMRNLDYDLKKIYVPMSLKSSLQSYETWTETVSTTGDSFAGHNENRFVVEVTSIANTTTFILEGSNDGTFWKIVSSLSFAETGTKSIAFPERWSNYRYKSITDDSVTFCAYVVDAQCDFLVVWKTVMNVLLPSIGKGDTAKMLYDELKAMYMFTLSNLKLDIDEDESETIDDDEMNAKKRTRRAA